MVRNFRYVEVEGAQQCVHQQAYPRRSANSFVHKGIKYSTLFLFFFVGEMHYALAQGDWERFEHSVVKEV